MKILKLLNNKNFTILLIFFLTIYVQQLLATDSVDIWNLENNSKEITTTPEDNIIIEKKENKNLIYEMQLQKKNIRLINEDNDFSSKKSNIIGIYDPADNDLSINMWSYSDGLRILQLMEKINKIDLSKDSIEILDIVLLTNTFQPQNNISTTQFLNLKSDWLIKQSDLNLIKKYLIKNKNLKYKGDLLKFYIDEYLSKGDIASACEIFENLDSNFEDNYLSKFNIYCLINDKKNDVAQLQLDLLIESGFKNKFFENTFSYLMGYEVKIDKTVSEESLLDFHLSHLTNSNFIFNPTMTTSKLIWRYLSSFNLLASVESIDLQDKNKVFSIEKATSEKNYTEKDLFELYKRFMFNINQLLSVEQSFKVLPNHEARALVYQGILLEKNSEEKIKLIKILKDLFIQENISNAFDTELVKLLKLIDKVDVPSSHTSFYDFYIESSEIKISKIKFNNKILHQSKLLNYFTEKKNSKKNTEKELADILKKTKKNKKYFFSTKDIILLESLKSDGIKIPKNYDEMFELNQALVPVDLQILINNNETGLVLLRLVQIIGEDMIKDMDTETLYFIIDILNQLNIDKLRNKVLIKVLPLKV